MRGYKNRLFITKAYNRPNEKLVLKSRIYSRFCGFRSYHFANPFLLSELVIPHIGNSLQSISNEKPPWLSPSSPPKSSSSPSGSSHATQHGTSSSTTAPPTISHASNPAIPYSSPAPINQRRPHIPVSVPSITNYLPSLSCSGIQSMARNPILHCLLSCLRAHVSPRGVS